MQYQLNNIINNLTETYEGTPWHGLSLKVILKDITTDMAFYRPFEQKHNIAELVAHILVWRQFATEILNENYDFSIDIGAMADFPNVAESEKVWKELQILLDENQVLLVSQMDEFEPTKLDYIIPKKTFTYRYLFDGVAYHDVYHGGQIALIKAAFLTKYNPVTSIAKALDFNSVLANENNML
jgi:hypothetical protein